MIFASFCEKISMKEVIDAKINWRVGGCKKRPQGVQSQGPRTSSLEKKPVASSGWLKYAIWHFGSPFTL